MRNYPDQSAFAKRLSLTERIDHAVAATGDAIDFNSNLVADHDLLHRIIALEDRRFFAHAGIDPQGTCREISRLLRGKKPFGASTITMQLVRIASGDFNRDIVRKSVEMLSAMSVERQFRKYEILSAYYNCAYIGYNINTWQDAAKVVDMVFGKDYPLRYEAMASALVSPIPNHLTPLWIETTRRRSERIALALSARPLSVDHERIILNNFEHVSVK